MKNQMKKGNTGVVVLITLLFVMVIAMSLYIAYDKLYVKNDSDVTGNNQDNIQSKEEEYKITSLSAASELLGKYYYNAWGTKVYLTDMKNKNVVALMSTNVSDTISQANIKETASYSDKNTNLFTAQFYSENVNFYSYEDVQENLRKLFGPNAVLEKETHINCSNSYFYVKEYDGFVEGQISCGGLAFTEQLQVYNFENVAETLYVYANWTRTSIAQYAGETSSNEKKAYKYTFKLQNTEYYLDNIQEI